MYGGGVSDAHGHGHGGHGHGHGMTADTDRRWLGIALALILGFMAVEVVVGIAAQSLALISDAAHMLTDGIYDTAAAGHVLLERPARLLLDVRPGGIGDRSELAVQVVHDWLLLFRLPMPRDPESGSPAGSGGPEVPGGSGRSSRKSADGTKNRLPVTAVEKSRMRS